MVEPTSIAADVGGQTGPNNGFLPQKQAAAAAGEEEDEPMLATKRPKVKIEADPSVSADRHKASLLSNYKVIQCLVLLVVLSLVGLLCSVFIKPELYFTDYGKLHSTDLVPT